MKKTSDFYMVRLFIRFLKDNNLPLTSSLYNDIFKNTITGIDNLAIRYFNNVMRALWMENKDLHFYFENHPLCKLNASKLKLAWYKVVLKNYDKLKEETSFVTTKGVIGHSYIFYEKCNIIEVIKRLEHNG